MITAVMREVRNCFPGPCLRGKFTIDGGRLIAEAPLTDFAVLCGSTQDGLHDLSKPFRQDETFTGTVVLCQPPEDFIALCEEIAAWCKAHPDPSLRSESFGEYSRSLSGSTDWISAFAPRLRPYRRMFSEVKL